MNKKIILLVGVCLLVGSVAFFTLQKTEGRNNVYNPATGERWDSVEDYIYRDNYQGPIRPIDNEKHFRKTGETIPIGN